ncbi:hypothetical protein BKA66DRAFT_439518 [Pyrenochaeta sp. MPI-SDFR-AT-0127]|nr:hypothetical protein BKA66DRAFT_439518 [Pyrenochaeta sp. MPI-SDFR-AT-0127]
MSKIVPHTASVDGLPFSIQHDPVLDIAIHQVASMSLKTEEEDILRKFPTEVRLMIFEELLSVWPRVVYRGAYDFGPLDAREFDGEITIPWQILATCRKYYDEGMPIMYSKNRFVFCTGRRGEPGKFWRFPVSTRCMPFLTDLGIYLRCDTPTKEAAKRVAHFIKAITRLAVNLEFLVVLISSSCLDDRACPWDIMFCDHPVAKALVRLVEAKTVRHLKIRLHDSACVFPGFAEFLNQSFYKDGVPVDRSIIFSRSCTCPHYGPGYAPFPCSHCGWPAVEVSFMSTECYVPPACVESDMERMMNLQHELFELGILPPKDDDEEVDEANVGPYGGGPPIEDDYEENRKAFTAGMLLPGQVRRYRGVVAAPAVWFFHQTKITDYFNMYYKDAV